MRSQVYQRPEGIFFADENGKEMIMKPVSGGGFVVIDKDTGTIVEQVSTKSKRRQTKRDNTGAVVFAGTGTSRGTTGSLTGQTTNTGLTISLDTTANFVKAIAKMITTGTVTGGSAILKIMQGTSVIKSLTAATPTGTTTKTLTLTSPTVLTNPKVVLANNVTGGTLQTMTLTEQLDDLHTPQIPLV